MSIEDKRRIWAAEQARQIFPVDDGIAKLADEIYEDMVETKVARKSGERQGGALHGLGFKNWLGPWGAWANPDTQRSRDRIAASLRHKPYISKLMGFGLVGHPQRRVPMRAEWLKPYCRVGDPEEGSGAIMWGLENTRERDELFAAHYDYIVLRVWDNGEVVAQRESETLENGNTLFELKLDDDDYRFEVSRHNRSNHTKSGKWFDYAKVEGGWQLLPGQGRDWDGEYGDSGITHSGTDRVRQMSQEEQRRQFFHAQRIAHENATYGHLADRYEGWAVEKYLANAIAANSKRSADLWSIVQRIQEDRLAAAALKADDEKEDSGTARSPKAEAVEFIERIRDNPPNRAVRGNPVHVRKWNRALAALGVYTGEKPWSGAEIRARAEKWPDSPWARVAAVLDGIEQGGGSS